MPTKLESFIVHARSKDMDHQTIRMLLLSAGWKEKDIATALAAETLDMPVPSPTDTGSAKDAFFHLLVFTTLYSTVISLIVLAFEYVGRWFPDAALDQYAYRSGDVSGIRWAIAVIVVSFPLFALLSRALHREFKVQPEKLASGVRKWLTYLTLFVTACTLIGDFITLLFYLLDGELSVRFLTKVFAILVLAGMPFAYYFSALRMDGEQYRTSPLHARFLRVAFGITVAFIVYGIVLAGSPMQGRNQLLDQQRVGDLKAIQSQIYDSIYGSNRYPVQPASKPVVLPKPLPRTLDDIAANATYQKLRITDPGTGASYGYNAKGNSFELCAIFALSLDQGYDIFWNHPAGSHCFVFDALDPASK